MLGSPLTEYSVHLFKQSIQSCTLPSARKPVYRALCIVSLKHSAEYSVWSIQSAYYNLVIGVIKPRLEEETDVVLRWLWCPSLQCGDTGLWCTWSRYIMCQEVTTWSLCPLRPRPQTRCRCVRGTYVHQVWMWTIHQWPELYPALYICHGYIEARCGLYTSDLNCTRLYIYVMGI